MRKPAPSAADLAEDRDGFKFRSGHVALDFAATLAARHRAEPRELLAEPADLDRWIATSTLAAAVAVGAATPGDLRSAQALREALYRLALACIAGRAFGAADRALVNAWSARALPGAQLGPAPGKPGRAASPTDVSQVLAAIAHRAVDLYAGADAARIQKCAGCSILFVDASRAGRRRWCSMAACGNKDKVAAHRRRSARPTHSGARSSTRARGGRRETQ